MKKRDANHWEKGDHSVYGHIHQQDENTEKRKFPWKAYSTMSTNKTENRIGLTMEDLASNIIPIEEMM